jgi:hypothetical protein
MRALHARAAHTGSDLGNTRCVRGRLVTAYAQSAVEAKPPAAARAAAAAARAARGAAPPTGSAGPPGARHGAVAGAPSAGQQRAPAGRERAPAVGGPAGPAGAAGDDLVELEDDDAGWAAGACGGATARAVQVVRERGARPPCRALLAVTHDHGAWSELYDAWSKLYDAWSKLMPGVSRTNRVPQDTIRGLHLQRIRLYMLLSVLQGAT